MIATMGLAVATLATMASSPGQAEAVVTSFGANPNVLQGLDIVCGKASVTVRAGTGKVNGRTVKVTETTLAVAPSDSVKVDGEWYPIRDDKVRSWRGGTRLKAGRGRYNIMPGQLEPGTLVVRESDKPGATRYERDRDYVLDEFWGALSRSPNGRIQKGQRVVIGYVYGRRRVDRIEVHPDGKVTLQRGKPKVDCPRMPATTAGAMTLATVYRPYHARTIEPHHVFVVNEAKAARCPKPDLRPVAKTLAKLREGKPVTIVCWGDSVTVGGDASTPASRYVNLFETRLKQRFGKDHIQVINAGIGGTSTNGRLKDYAKEVLAHRPDLITVEFVNDMGMPVERLKKNWRSAIAQARDIGAEFVILTPHYVMPSWMHKKHSRGPETRANCRALRELAETERVGLADAALRWELLEYAGMPYEILLMNGINHPDDRGHALFVEELMRLLPKE